MVVFFLAPFMNHIYIASGNSSFRKLQKPSWKFMKSAVFKEQRFIGSCCTEGSNSIVLTFYWLLSLLSNGQEALDAIAASLLSERINILVQNLRTKVCLHTPCKPHQLHTMKL